MTSNFRELINCTKSKINSNSDNQQTSSIIKYCHQIKIKYDLYVGNIAISILNNINVQTFTDNGTDISVIFGRTECNQMLRSREISILTLHL